MARVLALAWMVAALSGSPADVTRIAVSAPVLVATLSGEQVAGVPAQLAWSPDGQRLYLRLSHSDRWANERFFHYEIVLPARQVRSLADSPGWNSAYWARKSGFSCPGAPDFRIKVDTRVERKSATGSGAGGNLGQNAGDPYGPGMELGPQGSAIMSSAMQSQNVTIVTWTLKGQQVGEFVNSRAPAGLTYGWAPEALRAIAYADSKQRLVLMDAAGRRREVAGARDVVLPAWSDDGARLAWVQRRGRSELVVMMADVKSST
jgi:hypothetical protein